MPWLYEQVSGRLLDPTGELVGKGYSGAIPHVNDPQAQSMHNVGPIPEGSYQIGQPHDTALHGPYVLPLTPYPMNEMFGRDGFLIHGDSVKSPGTASQGCLIVSRDVREKVWGSGDRELKVVASLPTETTG